VFLAGLGTLTIEAPDTDDRARAAEIATTYRELELGYVDAIVVALAERLDERTIATLDKRHFGVIRPRHVRVFELVP
jgi:predicted nucleic acid-binding protein